MNFDRDGACERVAGLVVASGAHLGAVFDPDGERLFLVDDEGAALNDHESLLAFVQLVCGHLLGDRIDLPVGGRLGRRRHRAGGRLRRRW